MKKMLLNGIWKMVSEDASICAEGQIPGSVYSILLADGQMEDPFYRENELDALKLADQGFTFTKGFDVDPQLLSSAHQILRFDGVDTLADIYLNGTKLGETFNFHRYWEFDVKGILREKDNELRVEIHSPTKYIAEKDREYHIGGSTDAMAGFPYLRKTHCMFGWDWGPRLPDEGIWKDVSLLCWEDARLGELQIRQRHEDGNVFLTVCQEVIGECCQESGAQVVLTLTAPDGSVMELKNGVEQKISDPQLWWPNGLGAQPLYTVTSALCKDGGTIEEITKRIGLRTMKIRREKDQWGESFAHEVNGQTFFAMGADYIPEDNILSRITKERTRKLLEDCIESHFNVIRVWGGGYYPSDDFYDLCDELGLVVWQDMMFACANYPGTDEWYANITVEIEQNVCRLRHHPSLGLWCGNNEMEQFAAMMSYDGDAITRADYLIQNEYVIPQIVKREDPDAFYWPSSPSSGGKYVEPSSPFMGDIHYWEVWHGGVPFSEYRKYKFRYLSEFGFQSFPCLRTVESFTLPEDRNIFSRVMERHQRNGQANGKILQYLSMTYLYPQSFELLLYASQLLQADAIRYGVEHFRRNRTDNQCMGAVYWQLNDIWPVASWASIDYYGRWKALQYYAKRFFAPVMISCEEICETTTRPSVVAQPEPNISTAKLCVSNETWEDVKGTVIWELRDPKSRIIENGEEAITVPAFSAVWLDKLDFSETAYLENHLSYRFVVDDEIVSSGSVLFTAPKHYRFADPQLQLKVDKDTVTVCADAYARSVEIYSENGYVRLEDNYFDLEAGENRSVRIVEGDAADLRVRSVFDIR